jgi:hypothetical protein
MAGLQRAGNAARCFVEWAIAQALRGVVLRGPDLSAAGAVDLLWDIDEPERVRKLQEHCPDLLSYEEQRVLGAISDFALPGQQSAAFMTDDSVNWQLVGACWPELKAYALGKGSEQDLASAIRSRGTPTGKGSKK